MTDAEQRLRSSIASHESWARTPDRAARTLPARLALEAKWERAVDPDHKLLPAQRAKMAENARKAHYQRMALKSVQARQRKGK
jgi:hypothetical protein